MINPALQLRLVGAFASITALALVVETMLLGLLVARLADRLPSGGNVIRSEIPTLIIQALLASAVLVLPALILIGTRVTFRVAGPLYRMETHLNSITRGEKVGQCTIRKGDYLHPFCATLNKALNAINGEGALEGDERPDDDTGPESETPPQSAEPERRVA